MVTIHNRRYFLCFLKIFFLCNNHCFELMFHSRGWEGNAAPVVCSEIDSRTTRPMENSPYDYLPHDNSPHDYSPHGQLAPWTVHPMVSPPHGQIALWTSCPMDNLPHRQLAPCTILSNQIVLPYILTTFLQSDPIVLAFGLYVVRRRSYQCSSERSDRRALRGAPWPGRCCPTAGGCGSRSPSPGAPRWSTWLVFLFTYEYGSYSRILFIIELFLAFFVGVGLLLQEKFWL
jgi:hypothetical protein